MDIIGSIEPLVDEINDTFGLELTGDYLKMSGLVITTKHPSKISISEGSIDFSHTVSGKDVVLSFSLERSGGKIVAFTNPDGFRTEVVHGE